LAYSLDDAADHIGLGRTTMYRLVRDGELHALKVGRRTLVLESELRSFLDSKMAESTRA
jgi:excisionase family DNA binding protein